MEPGDAIHSVDNEDMSDYSVHQFLVRDDARDGSTADDDTKQGMATEIKKERALAARESFDPLETPDYSLAQTKAVQRRSKQPMEDEMERGDAIHSVDNEDMSDYSVHQFLVRDDARDGSTADD